MSSLCRMCGDEAEITTSLLDTSQHHLQWAINQFHIELDGVLPTSVCVHCDEIIRHWTLFLSKRKKAILLFSTMIASNLSLIHRLTSDTSNTSVPGKPSTSVCSTLLRHQVSNNVPQNDTDSIKSIINANFISVNDNSSFTTPIEAIYIPDIKSELDLGECEISMEVSSKNIDADKQLAIQIENPLNTASSSLAGTERLQHPQEPRQLTSKTSNTLLEGKPSFSDRSTIQFPMSAIPSSASLSDLNLLQHLVKKYHIKDLIVRVSSLSDQVLDSLQQNDTVDCNVVDNQMSERRNVRIKLEPVTVDACVCDDQVSDNLQQNLSSTVDDDDIEVPFEAINIPIVKCEPDLVETEPRSDLSASQFENHLLEIEIAEADSDLLELAASPETTNPSCNMDVHTSPSVISCGLCSFTSSCQREIKSHIVNQHVTTSSYQCQVCRKSFQYQNYLHRHFSRVHPNECSYNCLQCKQGFQSEKHFKAHIKNHDKILQCDVCGKILSTKRALAEHKIVFHSESSSLSCDMCGKIFSTDRCLKAHTRAVHCSLSYKCDICDKSFKLNAHLCKHQREVHASVRAFSCNQCEKTFVSKAALKQHTVVHSDLRPFECDICNLCFSRIGHLTRHIRTVHSNVREFKCHICEKSFSNNYNVKIHLISHSDVRNYKCEQCGKQFKTKRDLKQHLTSHSEIRPFACAQCHKKFKSKSYLVTHLRQVHSDLRPFCCDKCSFACKSRYTLKLHQVVHSNVRKFECCHCESKFRYRSHLISHLKKKHLNLW